MFEPLHRDHAIETVLLRLTGSGEMMEHERANLDEGYERYWKAALPTVSRAQVMEIAMGPTPLVDGQPKSLAPTCYVEFMRTGKAAWWMEIDGPMITVGCAQYEGWKSVSGKACELFASLGKTLGNIHPLGKIRSMELTYEDLLVWRGDSDDYNPRLAIRKERIPEPAKNSKEWHIGEGWIQDPEGKRILERFQVGAELRRQENRTHPVIRITTTAIWGFARTTSCLNLDRAFRDVQSVDGNNGDGRSIYNDLHRRTHTLFGSLIEKKIASQIGMNRIEESA